MTRMGRLETTNRPRANFRHDLVWLGGRGKTIIRGESKRMIANDELATNRIQWYAFQGHEVSEGLVSRSVLDAEPVRRHCALRAMGE